MMMTLRSRVRHTRHKNNNGFSFSSFFFLSLALCFSTFASRTKVLLLMMHSFFLVTCRDVVLRWLRVDDESENKGDH